MNFKGKVRLASSDDIESDAIVGERKSILSLKSGVVPERQNVPEKLDSRTQNAAILLE
jgi:hypothetical protein